jgi:hypothetical protein
MIQVRSAGLAPSAGELLKSDGENPSGHATVKGHDLLVYDIDPA